MVLLGNIPTRVPCLGVNSVFYLLLNSENTSSADLRHLQTDFPLQPFFPHPCTVDEVCAVHQAAAAGVAVN